MTGSTPLSHVALQAIDSRMRALAAQVRCAVEPLTEEELWWRANPGSNSVGTLVLHLAGALRHYVAHAIGGFPYERDREAEFIAQALPKAEVLALFDTAVEQVARTLATLDHARLSAPSTQPDYYGTLFEDLLGAAIHMSTHVGQIVYATKAMREGSLDELWPRTHREAGVWRT